MTQGPQVPRRNTYIDKHENKTLCKKKKKLRNQTDMKRERIRYYSDKDRNTRNRSYLDEEKRLIKDKSRDGRRNYAFPTQEATEKKDT